MNDKRWALTGAAGHGPASRRLYAGRLPGPFASWAGAMTYANLAARNDRLSYRITRCRAGWQVEPDGRRCDPQVWYVNCSTWYKDGDQVGEYAATVHHLPSGRIYGAKSYLGHIDARRRAFAGILAAFDASERL